MSYIGSAGRRLIQTANARNANPSFADAQLVTNGATSNYNALQVQFRRQLSHGLEGLVSYTWAHSIDTASAGSTGLDSNDLLPANANVNRGPSDFDIRHGFSAAITYEVPTFKSNGLLDQIVRSWSLQSIVHVQSASPAGVLDGDFQQQLGVFRTQVRPDVVPGMPFYLSGPHYPGGKAFNAAAFVHPPTTPAGCDPEVDFPCDPARQGNLARNALRGFGLAQWDFAIHRDFAIHESLKLQFRAEMFNVVNHPNFGPPSGCLGPFCGTPFGVAMHTLAQSLGANVGTGGFDPLYQLGGPRSVQLALKLTF
jgi:hypothetical protein